jgi:hypothetical protein
MEKTIYGAEHNRYTVPSGMMRRFELHRDDDVTGISGTGVVAEGVILSSGTAVLEWLTEWPTSVVWHDRGLASLEHVHGHNGRTRIVWLDGEGE